jgi:hypothetical protein
LRDDTTKQAVRHAKSPPKVPSVVGFLIVNGIAAFFMHIKHALPWGILLFN